MSATDELRRLLDERGVEWDYGITGAATTRFNANGLHLTFTPMRYGLVCSTILTPEQAIEATLWRDQPPYEELIEALRRNWDIEASWDGLRRFWCVYLTEEGVRKREEMATVPERGTCHVECFDDGVDEALDGEWISYAPPTWYLSCGHTVEGSERPKYCCECGRKVVDA